ncbi:MAG: rhomboid family intramembrane serine protease [Candidatus Altiarchaeota archaeon]|nr:rhomboid family intramembrane serine protease [Candidatus Altiarchaeota archaeon]
MGFKDWKYIPVTYWLLGILAVVFVVQLISLFVNFPFTELLILDPEAVLNGQNLWGVFTNMFLHGSPIHLLFNAWALWMFGLALERIVGSKNLLKIFLISGIFASIFYILTSVFILNMSASALGASGAIFGVVGAMIALRPHTRVMLLFPPVPMELWMLGVFFVLIAVFWFGTGGGTGIAENAHLGGLLIGLLMGLYFKKKEVKDPDFDWRAWYT